MVSSASRVSFRMAFILLLLLAAFYVGRPLYWKLSATIHDIREKRTTVKEGISQFVLDARRSVGWIHQVPDAEVGEDQTEGLTTSRRILGFADSKSKRKW